MKKLGIALGSLLFLLALGFALMQGEFGKKFVKKALEKAVAQSGYQVHIDQIEGTLPHQIKLKGVSIQGENLRLTIADLQLRPVLWRLLKAEMAFTNIQAKEISVNEGTPFDFSNGRFRINSRRVFVRGDSLGWNLFIRYHIKIKSVEFSAANDLFLVRGDAELLPKLTGNLLIRSDYLLASIDIAQEGESYQGKAVWQVPRNEFMGPFDGTAALTYQDHTLKGTIAAGSFAKAEFDLTQRLGEEIRGAAALKIDNLQALSIPDVYGKMEAKGRLTEVANIEMAFTEFFYKDLYAQNLFVVANLTPFKLQGGVKIDGENLKWNYLELSNAQLETSIGEENAPYRLTGSGNLRHPLEIASAGVWQPTLIQIDSLTGTFLDAPFALNQPVQIVHTDTDFRLQNVFLNIGDGSAAIDIDRKGEDTKAALRLTDIPIDFLSLNPLDVAVGGTMNLTADLQEKNNQLMGSFEIALNQTTPVPATGYFEGSFHKNQLQAKGGVWIRENPLLELDLTVPIHFSIWPFQAECLYHKETRGALHFDGKVEEILDYFDLGASRLEGHLQGSLTFRNTLYRPLVEGKFTFENGLYENYYSGTALTNMRAEILAEKNSLYLQSLIAQDRPGTGTFEAIGELQLLQSDFYPYLIDAKIQNLQFAEIDLVKALADGKVRIEGNALSAVAQGDIHVRQCELTIPDHIPKPMPNLEVTYRNAIHPLEPVQKEHQPYPIHLDLNIAAPADITISGRGLSSHWKGDFHLGGTYTSLAAKGTLELIEGEFNFSSRSFKLIEGALIFSGVEHQMPYLNLAGQMETKGITITARLKGPLDDPQITLLSNPPLPLGSIMSYLLFGQDISEIGGFQALQLATSLASLAGTGPDVMEATRKSLGVDRLQVIAEPSEEGGETVALQVGKYISKGVLVSFSQGTEESSTNISVEIELKNNFVFQIESDQRQEQGRFTLKWNLSY